MIICIYTKTKHKAAWNFWTNPNQDATINPPGMWTNTDNNYRSPELFHEMFAGGPERLKSFASRFVLFRLLSVEGIHQLWYALGKENVLLLKSEDMKPHVVNTTGGFLDKLSDFTGLDRSLYSDRIFQYSNCGNSKGAGSVCGNDTGALGAYDIAGSRGMLPETREFIYLYFWEECKIWSKEFGVHYPDCVNVMNNTNANL